MFGFYHANKAINARYAYLEEHNPYCNDARRRNKQWDRDGAAAALGRLARDWKLPLTKLRSEVEAGSLFLECVGQDYIPPSTSKAIAEIPMQQFSQRPDFYMSLMQLGKYGHYDRALWQRQSVIFSGIMYLIHSGGVPADGDWSSLYFHTCRYIYVCRKSKPEMQFLTRTLSILWYYGLVEVDHAGNTEKTVASS